MRPLRRQGTTTAIANLDKVLGGENFIQTLVGNESPTLVSLIPHNQLRHTRNLSRGPQPLVRERDWTNSTDVTNSNWEHTAPE